VTASHLLGFQLFQTVQNKQNQKYISKLYHRTVYKYIKEYKYIKSVYRQQVPIWHKKFSNRNAAMKWSQTKPRPHRIDECAAFVWCLLTNTIIEFRVEFFSANVKQLLPLSETHSATMRLLNEQRHRILKVQDAMFIE